MLEKDNQSRCLQYNKYQAAIQAAEGEAKYCSMNRTYTIDTVTEEQRIIVAPPNDRHAVFREIKAKLKDRQVLHTDHQVGEGAYTRD